MFKTIFSIIFTIIILPIYLPLLLLFMLYHKCVDLILSQKIGGKYGGLLQRGDASWALQKEVTKSVVNVILMVEFNSSSDFYETIKYYMKTKIFDDSEKSIKFTSVCKNEYGYFYLLKNEYNVDECVKELNEDVRDKNDLQEILNKYANVPLPKNHTALWEVLVCKNSIKWKNCENCYPVICRFNHTMSDGLHALDAFGEIFSDRKLNSQEKRIASNNVTKTQMFLLHLRKLLFHAYIMVVLPSNVLIQHILKKSDSNPLYGKKLSKKTVLTWKIEDSEIITKIKKIKNKIPQTTFMDVLLTAISASYEEYFVKNNLEVPKNFTVGYIVDFKPFDSERCKAPVLINNFAAAFLSMPIHWNSNSLVDKLKEIRRRQKIVKGNDNIEVNYWLCTILPSFLPRQILNIFSDSFILTLIISNIPVVPCWNLFGEYIIKDMITWTIHFCSCGMSLVLLSYGNEGIQLGLSVNEALINSGQDINDVLNGIGKYVNELEEDLFQLK